MAELNSSDVYIYNKRNRLQLFKQETIKKYLSSICEKASLSHLDIDALANNVYPKLKKKNTIEEIKNQIIASASEMMTDHYDYQYIATWILINDLHKRTYDDYLKVVTVLRSNVNKKGNPAPIVNRKFARYVKEHQKEINEMFCYERDYQLTIFGYRTLEKAYLKKLSNGNIVERPQHLYMRVAIAIHYRNNRLDLIRETYHLLSQGYFTHATPTLFNAGTLREQLSSCFLLGIGDDMKNIGECIRNCLLISKYAGGIGINVSNIRVDGAYINSTQGTASGLRLITIFDVISRYADQCGRRAGSFAIFVEPWHNDVFFYLDSKKNIGAETERARNLFIALMVNDIFMKRVEEDDVWSLMCPADCPDLLNKYGEEFTRIYQQYESRGCYVRQIPARNLWFRIMESQFESGVPYIIYKDHVNYKSNQINIGVINGSNLCCEIVEFTSPNEIACCNLASICLPKFVEFDQGKPNFNFTKLKEIAQIVTRNLNNIIDINYYPVKSAKKSNLRNRPVGIGVQGLADVFLLYQTPFDSELARDLNRKIFETIYFGALTESMMLAAQFGHYETYPGSPISEGKFQFDLWGLPKERLSGLWDWEELRNQIKKYGVRNSLLTACMPTASTSQILSNTECFEPNTSNIYTRSTIAGDYYVVSKYLLKALMDKGLWNSDIVDLIKYYDGSIQSINCIPDDIKAIFRTVWEIPQKSIIEMAADRGPFVDQTQSMNIFIDKTNFAKLNSCLFKSWKLGLKTGIYYLRSKAGTKPLKFGIDAERIEELVKKYGLSPDEEDGEKNNETMVCPLRPSNLGPGQSCWSCQS